MVSRPCNKLGLMLHEVPQPSDDVTRTVSCFIMRWCAVMAATSRPTVDDALRAGRRKFLAPERLDMSALAEELGVNRVTLYRWVGSRAKLLVEAVWALAEQGLGF